MKDFNLYPYYCFLFIRLVILKQCQIQLLRSELIVLLSIYFKYVRFNIVSVYRFTSIGSVLIIGQIAHASEIISIVYQFRCEQCASEYVWMTARTLSTREDEHVGRGQ